MPQIWHCTNFQLQNMIQGLKMFNLMSVHLLFLAVIHTMALTITILIHQLKFLFLGRGHSFLTGEHRLSSALQYSIICISSE